MTNADSQFIRPMSLAELLDRAIGLYRRNFFKFIGIIAIPLIPLNILQMVVSYFTNSSLTTRAQSGTNPFSAEVLLGYAGMLVIGFFQFILVQGIGTAALTRAIADNYTGQQVGILDSYDRIGKSWLSLIVALILMAVIFIPAYIWTFFIPCVGWITGPGLLIFLYLAVLPLISPVVVLENPGATGALRRAWDLARSRFWWLLGCALVLYLFGWLIVQGPVLLLTFLLSTLLQAYPLLMEQQLIVSTILQSLTTLFTSLLYLPIQITLMTLVYFDLRARSEGLDLAMQLSVEPQNEIDVVPLPDIAAQSPAPFLTTTDAGRFALLSLAVVALYGLLFGLIFGIAALLIPAVP
jgi:hypothetical protein